MDIHPVSVIVQGRDSDSIAILYGAAERHLIRRLTFIYHTDCKWQSFFIAFHGNKQNLPAYKVEEGKLRMFLEEAEANNRLSLITVVIDDSGLKAMDGEDYLGLIRYDDESVVKDV